MATPITIDENTIIKLIVRAGTERNRRQLILSEGEPAYTVDTRRFFIGDGRTPGGRNMANRFLGEYGTPQASWSESNPPFPGDTLVVPTETSVSGSLYAGTYMLKEYPANLSVTRPISGWGNTFSDWYRIIDATTDPTEWILPGAGLSYDYSSANIRDPQGRNLFLNSDYWSWNASGRKSLIVGPSANYFGSGLASVDYGYIFSTPSGASNSDMLLLDKDRNNLIQIKPSDSSITIFNENTTPNLGAINLRSYVGTQSGIIFSSLGNPGNPNTNLTAANVSWIGIRGNGETTQSGSNSTLGVYAKQSGYSAPTAIQQYVYRNDFWVNSLESNVNSEFRGVLFLSGGYATHSEGAAGKRKGLIIAPNYNEPIFNFLAGNYQNIASTSSALSGAGTVLGYTRSRVAGETGYASTYGEILDWSRPLDTILVSNIKLQRCDNNNTIPNARGTLYLNGGYVQGYGNGSKATVSDCYFDSSNEYAYRFPIFHISTVYPSSPSAGQMSIIQNNVGGVNVRTPVYYNGTTWTTIDGNYGDAKFTYLLSGNALTVNPGWAVDSNLFEAAIFGTSGTAGVSGGNVSSTVTLSIDNMPKHRHKHMTFPTWQDWINFTEGKPYNQYSFDKYWPTGPGYAGNEGMFYAYVGGDSGAPGAPGIVKYARKDGRRNPRRVAAVAHLSDEGNNQPFDVKPKHMKLTPLRKVIT